MIISIFTIWVIVGLWGGYLYAKRKASQNAIDSVSNALFDPIEEDSVSDDISPELRKEMNETSRHIIVLQDALFNGPMDRNLADIAQEIEEYTEKSKLLAAEYEALKMEAMANDICPECGNTFAMTTDYICKSCRDMMEE